jgi:Tol biopolymer transport system component/tRNA A-37 threonylcarbamoyl transferase component Bud32
VTHLTAPPASLADALRDRYVFERELGQGGMATVYLAEDLRHRRKVALKLLRPELAASLGPDRFLREIQIAAQLQHPHILPLLDSGEVDGFLYYVMPYVDGESLRARLARQGELSVPEAARVLREVADALSYAHERGVVHRDIKPDNVLLSGRHALVTDFGVAKAVSEATGRHTLTTAGVALGTPTYMAPEQATADPHTDHRVDLYALGAMGYELLAGRPPFVASTAQEVLAAHVTRAPEPLQVLRPSCPPMLAQLIMRCLEKKPSDRPQSAEELLPVLETVATPSGGITPTETRPTKAVHWRRPVAAVVVSALIVLGGAGALFLRPRAERPLTLGRQSRITDVPGLETDPVISADGRLIAYAAGPYFQSHIYVRQLSGGSAIDLTPTLPGRHTRPRWAPGGSELLFVTNDARTRRLSRISALGGVPRGLVELEGSEAITSADWSPDGTRVVYDLGSTLWVSTPGAAPSRLYEGTDPHSVSWSPDGRFIAFVEGHNRLWHGATGFTNTAPSAILVAPVGGGPVDTVAPHRALNLSPAWTPDSRGLFFISDRDGAKDVYRARLTSDGRLANRPERLSTGLNAHTLTLSADGRMLTFSTLVREANVWMVQLRPGQVVTEDRAVQVTTGNQVIERLTLSPDGHWLVFDSDRRGNADIYRLRLDQPGAEPEQLTADSANDYSPIMSPDRREILFHSLRLGNRDLWLMSSDGTNQRPLTRTPQNEFSGAWSPDGHAISFYAESAGTLWLGIVSRGERDQWGTRRLVLPRTSSVAWWSPDGTRLAAIHDGAVVIIPFPPGDPVVLFRPPPATQPTRSVMWSPDGRSVYYRLREPDGRLTFLGLPVAGKPPVTLVRQRDPSKSGARSDWITDGRRFFFTIHRYEGDIWTVEIR